MHSIEGQIERVPDSVAKACDCLHRIEEKFQRLTKQCSLCTKPFLLAAKIKQRLEELEFAAETANDKILHFDRVGETFSEYKIKH